jgi:hypothetical protein
MTAMILSLSTCEHPASHFLHPLAKIRSHASLRRHRLPAIAPVAVLGGTAVATAAAWVLRAPLLSRLASAWLGSRVRVSRVAIAPRRCLCVLHNVKLWDPRNRELVALEAVHVTSSRDVPGGKRRIDVELVRPEVVLLFNNVACSQSNWGDWAKRFVPTTARRPAPSAPANSDGKQRIRLDISGGVKLSVRSEVFGGQRIIDDVQLSELDDLGRDILSPGSAALLVERLAAKAIRSGPRFKIPSAELRAGVRGHARSVLRSESRGLRALGRIHIKRLKTQISAVDKYIEGVPQLDRIGEITKASQAVLGQLDSLLKMIDPKSTSSTSGDDEVVVRDVVVPSQTAVDASLVHPVQNSSSSLPPSRLDIEVPPTLSSPVAGYRELDEEWEGQGKRSKRSS